MPLRPPLPRTLRRRGRGRLTSRVASELGTSKKNVITSLVASYLGSRASHAGSADGGDPGGEPRRVVIDMGAPPVAVGHAAFFPYEPAEVLTAAEVASLLQVDVTVIESLAAAREMPGRRIAGEWRFSRAAILRWLDHPDAAPEPTHRRARRNAAP